MGRWILKDIHKKRFNNVFIRLQHVSINILIILYVCVCVYVDCPYKVQHCNKYNICITHAYNRATDETVQ